MSPFRKKKTKIGELLLLSDLITPEQLRKALNFQLTEGKDKPLGQVILELGFVNKDSLDFILAVQSGYPYIQIKNYKIESELLSLLPEETIRKYRVFPIDKIKDVFTVAMVNPIDSAAVDQVKKIIKDKVIIFLTTSSEFNEMLAMYFAKA